MVPKNHLYPRCLRASISSQKYPCPKIKVIDPAQICVEISHFVKHSSPDRGCATNEGPLNET